MPSWKALRCECHCWNCSNSSALGLLWEALLLEAPQAAANGGVTIPGSPACYAVASLRLHYKQAGAEEQPVQQQCVYACMCLL